MIASFISRVLEFFYPPFRQWMPFQTFRYAACGAYNTAMGILVFFVGYNFIFKKQLVPTPIVTLSPHIAAMILSFMVTFPVGLKELNQNTLTVYPNPSTGVFYISGKELGGATVKVYDMTGRVVTQAQIFNGDDTAIDMIGFNQGMYQMVVEHNGQTYRAKVNLMT
ncbi:MAG: T9SS type A sorting domain-containing protein [Chitinophagaceae bacterium]|nr:T9SS type A sorting domain-containing protein [Chitinophagaceae bacterium]